ncbi:MAG TPA: zf-TFIIB domain-containing protein [Solirubrobacterales bacterium]|nr:zf-TFIIB domain-containing protein [Solirubrobacterales bacterium]
MSTATKGEAMTCPKCGAEMRTHRRNGVTIEQCRKCHGIFLDRGELEQLIGRETSLLGHDGEVRGERSGERRGR